MKKIFAVVLSLCMVLSSFVAVSAAEQVYNEGVYNEGIYNEGNVVTLFEDTKTFEAEDYSVLIGGGYAATLVDDPAGERTGKVLGGAITAGGTGYFGFEIPTLDAGDVITYSIDVYFTQDWTTGGNGSTQNIMMRAGNNWGPSGSWQTLLNNGETVPANKWTTLSGTYTVPSDLSDEHLFVQVRPNVTMDGAYYDNFSMKIEGARETVVNTTETFDESTGLLGSSVSYSNGTATAAMASGHGGTVGVQFKDAEGNHAAPLKNGDMIAVSVDVKPASNITPSNYTDLVGLLFRENQSTGFPASGTIFKQLLPNKTIPAGEWTTLTGYFTAQADWTNTGSLAMGFRVGSDMNVEFDNFHVALYRAAEKVEPGWEVEPGWDVEPGWADADYSIDYIASKNAAANPGTLTGNVYTATMDEFEAFYNNGNCSYNPWVKLDTNIPVGTNFKLSYDLTTEGVNNSIGGAYATLTVRARFYNASNTEINSSYRPNAAVTANTGEAVHYELNVDPTQLTQDVASVRIVVDLDNAAKNAKNDEGAYITISNWDLERTDSFVTSSAAKTANGVELTLTNANAQKYKFAGRLLIAEYATVVEDGKEVKELVQFAEVAVDEEIAAGDDVVVTAEFEKDITAGNEVRVFIWEPASFEAIKATEIL